jgi:predicted metal-dependent hydrolase
VSAGAPEHGGDPPLDPAALERAFADGIALFDAGRYHDAHERFEELWLASEGPDSDFYKGLIQAAICLHHLQRGNLEGARKLYGDHRRYLGAYLPAHRGIDVAGFLAQMQAALAPALRARAGETAALAGAPRLAPAR